MKLRPEVRRFAENMERKLRKHDDDWGDSWRTMYNEDVWARIEGEMKELQEVLHDEVERVGEAADVANFLMFLVEKRRHRPQYT